MTVVAFVGPTISRAEAETVLPARYLPPAAQGDVYDAALTRPDIIAIIDGSFGNAPSVWHKEILWAMAQGIHVFGASSMGALRAAELSSFGMVGVGDIFAAFQNNELEDDDEVAIIHGPAAIGYLPASEALVNMRATFAAAVAHGILDAHGASAMVQIAKNTFYADRRYDTIIDVALADGIDVQALRRFEEWLPLGAVDVKRRDALALFTLLGNGGAPTGPKRIAYSFHETELWTQFTESRDGNGPSGRGDHWT